MESLPGRMWLSRRSRVDQSGSDATRGRQGGTAIGRFVGPPSIVTPQRTCMGFLFTCAGTTKQMPHTRSSGSYDGTKYCQLETASHHVTCDLLQFRRSSIMHHDSSSMVPGPEFILHHLRMAILRCRRHNGLEFRPRNVAVCGQHSPRALDPTRTSPGS